MTKQTKPDSEAVISPNQAALTELHAKRRDLVAAMQDLQTKIARVNAAPTEEAAVRSEIGRLDAEESAAAQSWAENGAVGEPPAVDMKARVALNDRLTAAVAKTAASTSAKKALESKMHALSLQVNGLILPIGKASITVLVDKLEGDVKTAQEMLTVLHPLLSSLDACRKVIVDDVYRLNQTSGFQAADISRRLEGIPGIHEMMTSHDPIQTNYGEWAAKLETLKKGD